MAQVVVNGTTFEVGRATPAQVAGIAKLISSVSIDARKNIVKSGLDGNGDAVMWAVLGELDEERLVGLAALVIGSDKEFARENFDLIWVTEALALIIEETNLSRVIGNFTRIFTLAQDSPAESDLSETG